MQGFKFNNLVVLRKGQGMIRGIKQDKPKLWPTWVCRCICGIEIEVLQNNIIRAIPSPLSCGCIKGKGRTTHGLSKHPLYIIWVGMNQRCYNIKDSSYPFYGSRGIKVCKRWRKSVSNFITDMGPTYTKGLTLDRVNNAKSYSPKNCKWSNISQQSKNKRSSINIKLGDHILSLTEIAEELNMPKSSIYFKYHNLGLKEFKQYCLGKNSGENGNVKIP